MLWIVLTLSFAAHVRSPSRECRTVDSQRAAEWITANFDRCPACISTDLDLARTSVFLDFDGTITHADVGVHVLERVGARRVAHDRRAVPPRRDRQPRVHARRVGAGRGRRGDAARDRGGSAARSGLRAAGRRRCAPPAPSSPWCPTGSASTSRTRCAPFGLDVLTNAVDFATGELLVPARGPLLPVRVVRRVQAGADQGRAAPRADHGADRRRHQRPQGRAPRRRGVRQGLARLVVRARSASSTSPFDTLDDVHRHAAVTVDERRVRHRRAHRRSPTRCAPTSRRAATTVVVGRRRAVGRGGPRGGRAVADGRADTGVLFCWTGTGASIAANKVPGVRAALCTDAATAAGARTLERRQRARDGPAAHQPRGGDGDARRLVRHRGRPRRGR